MSKVGRLDELDGILKLYRSEAGQKLYCDLLRRFGDGIPFSTIRLCSESQPLARALLDLATECPTPEIYCSINSALAAADYRDLIWFPEVGIYCSIYREQYVRLLKKHVTGQPMQVINVGVGVGSDVSVGMIGFNKHNSKHASADTKFPFAVQVYETVTATKPIKAAIEARFGMTAVSVAGYIIVSGLMCDRNGYGGIFDELSSLTSQYNIHPVVFRIAGEPVPSVRYFTIPLVESTASAEWFDTAPFADRYCFYFLALGGADIGCYKYGITDDIDRRLREHRKRINYASVVRVFTCASKESMVMAESMFKKYSIKQRIVVNRHGYTEVVKVESGSSSVGSSMPSSGNSVSSSVSKELSKEGGIKELSTNSTVTVESLLCVIEKYIASCDDATPVELPDEAAGATLMPTLAPPSALTPTLTSALTPTLSKQSSIIVDPETRDWLSVNKPMGLSTADYYARYSGEVSAPVSEAKLVKVLKSLGFTYAKSKWA
jgi:predicted GIY-YIG superfamily endonuclease